MFGAEGSVMMKCVRGCGRERPAGEREVSTGNMAVSEMLRSENSDTFFRCVVFQPGDAGSRLVVGDAGDGRSGTLSKRESLLVDRGELGADKAKNSDWSSVCRDQRLLDGIPASLDGDISDPASAPR